MGMDFLNNLLYNKKNEKSAKERPCNVYEMKMIAHQFTKHLIYFYISSAESFMILSLSMRENVISQNSVLVPKNILCNLNSLFCQRGLFQYITD